MRNETREMQPAGGGLITETSLPFIIAAVFILLKKYSSYLFDSVNLEILTSGSSFQIIKVPENGASFSDFANEIELELLGKLTDGAISNEPISLKWLTENNRAEEDYQIFISKTQNDKFTIQISNHESAFFHLAFENTLKHLQIILQQITLNNKILIEGLTYLTDEENTKLAAFNSGIKDSLVAVPEFIHHLFERTADAFPGNYAIITNDDKITYAQLNSKADHLAAILQKNKVQAGDFVGVILKRSPELYISILAILKAGAAYVPIDIDYPDDRIQYILNDCNVKCVITNSVSYSHANLLSFNAVLFEKDLLQNENEVPKINLTDTHTPAYIIYTSGSTGRPKGVVISHAAASNLIKAEAKIFEVKNSDKVVQGFSVAFDASVEEIWLAFYSGAALLPVDAEIMHSGTELSEFINTNGVTVLSTVPTMLSMMQRPLPTLRLLILGGENCPHELLNLWHHSGIRIVNTYGPTEATVIATYADFSPDYRITIGKPIFNYSTYILDENLNPVAPGIGGELCIGGPGLATQYLNNPKQTADKFVQLKENSGELVYRTGDLVRFNGEGNIEFLGRIDSQVKLRGYRIELSEIESQILQIPEMGNAVVAVKEDAHKVQRLIAYVILKTGNNSIDENKWKNILKERLAVYMIPAAFVVLDNFPTLPSGKVDRKNLPEPTFSIENSREIISPENNTQKLIHTVWEKYFLPEKVSITDDFFDLGGHSLLASLIVSEMRNIPSLSRVSVHDIYTYRSVQKLAANILELQTSEINNPNNNSENTKQAFKKVNNFTYYTTSFLQFLSFSMFYLIGSIGLLTPFIVERMEMEFHPYLVIIYSVLSIFLAIPVFTALSIAAKWLIIGKFKNGRYPLWGWYYFRFWIVKKFIDLTPIGLFSGTPFLNFYFRCMGAKIGKGVYLGSDRIRIFDLVQIGDNSSISREANLLGYKVENGELIIGNITIGNNCFVGTRAVLSENSAIENHGAIGELSLLTSNSVIPENQYWRGSPALKTAIENYTKEQASKSTKGLPFPIYLCLQFFAMLFVIIFPLILIIPFVIAFYEIDKHYGLGWALFSILGSTAVYIALFCLLIALFKWIIIGKVKEQEFSIYSFKYIRKWTVDVLISMSLLYFRSVYATIFLPAWLRLMGAKIGRRSEISTVNQLNTDLLEIGAGSFLADSVSIGAPLIKNQIMMLKKISIGEKTFIGNSAVVSCGDKIGNNALIGVLSVPPQSSSESLMDGASWLGSPPAYLPQRQLSAHFPDQLTFNPGIGMYIKRGFVEFFKITLPYVISSILIALFYLIMNTILEGKSLHHLFWTAPLILFALFLITPIITILFKKILIGTYKPSNKPLWSVFVWNNELINSLCESMVYPVLVNMFLGTPFAPVFFRLMGCKIGKRVYMETTEITEFDLVHIGNNACINHLSTIQTHLFEDRVMKMSNLHVGNYCSIGSMSVVLYDSEMEDHSCIDALTLVMKGEVIPGGTKWAGSTAKFVN